MRALAGRRSTSGGVFAQVPALCALAASIASGCVLFEEVLVRALAASVTSGGAFSAGDGAR